MEMMSSTKRNTGGPVAVPLAPQEFRESTYEYNTNKIIPLLDAL